MARSGRVTTTNFTTTEFEGDGTTVLERTTNVDGTTAYDREDAQTSKIKTEMQDQTPKATHAEASFKSKQESKRSQQAASGVGPAK